MSQRRVVSRRLWVRVAALAGAGVLLGTSLIIAPPAAAAAAEAPLTKDSVKVTILSVSPTTPTPSTTPQPLTVRLRLTNTTDQSIAKVTVEGARGNPIDSQTALEQAIAHPQPPDEGLVGRFGTKAPVLTSLGPRASASVEYRSTSDTIPDDPGLCICQNRIYPLYFTAHATDLNGNDQVIGAGQTYIPAFGESLPQPVQVSWVWPIIDRPHRLTGDTVFTDDDLAASVNGGRLDRVLQVVESAGKQVTMTLVIDPELIDELAVMSAGPYQYGTTGKLAAGTGTAAATRWLDRLQRALAANPKIEVDFTPPADPDIESLTRNGLAWTVGLSEAAQKRVTAALGGYPVSTHVAWPPGGALSPDTLNAVVRQGARTVILSDSALSGIPRSSTRNALASLQTPAGPVLAAITTSTIQRYVAPVLSVGGTGLADLPKLVAEVAVRAVQDGTTSHYVTIVAPRLIDPSAVAAQAIRATSNVFWSKPLSLDEASPPTVQPADHGQLVPPPASALTLSLRTISVAQDLTRVVPALSTMLVPADAATLLGELPTAVQRAESASWHADPAAGAAFADQLSQRIEAIETGVQIVKPSGGTYTLASRTSPLTVTVENNLDVPVFVRVRVTAANGLPGFTAADIGRQSIAPHSRLPLHIPTHVARTGRFVVQAMLFTPSNEQLGAPVDLSVHSTALGAIGVIITITAAAVLVLALLIRFIRRLRNPKPVPGTAPPVIAP
ncbi:MAG: hypothetical protein JWP07_5071 [Pseudonocardiales bacterium]|nr:hypothetical protein [Pseudonocardiales bacterium]